MLQTNGHTERLNQMLGGAYFHLTPVSSDNNDVCIDVLEVGVVTQKSSGVLCAPEAEPPFLNF